MVVKGEGEVVEEVPGDCHVELGTLTVLNRLRKEVGSRNSPRSGPLGRMREVEEVEQRAETQVCGAGWAAMSAW